MSARRLYQTDIRGLPAQSLVVSKLEGERRLEGQLVAAIGTAFEPDANFASTAQSDANWANQESAKAENARTVLSTLIEESKIKTPPAGGSDAAAVTLEAAMANLGQSEVAGRQRVLAETSTAAAATGAKDIANAEADRILSEAKLEAARIRDAAKAEAEKQRQQQELVAAAQRLEAGKAKVAVDQLEDEARKVKLRAKAKEPRVQAKLAPFTTPGYWQINGSSYTKAPLSYKALLHAGALAETTDGLQRLVEIGFYRWDKDRPRWHFRFDNTKGWQKTSSEREMVTEVQQLLIELGPTLVELGYLQE
ncbi:MAG: hypothetical protein U1G08_04800 [Verrucomicrobiota bacterium]